MTIGRASTGRNSGLWGGGFLVEVAKEVIQRLVHFDIYIHGDVNRFNLDGLGLDAEATAGKKRDGEATQDKKALHGHVKVVA